MAGYGLDYADIYGGSLGVAVSSPTAAIPAEEQAGSAEQGNHPTSIKISWIVVVGLLVGIRLLYEMAE